jgi:hypothetical protein
MAVQVVPSQDHVVVGQDIGYTVTVTNTSGIPLTGVTVADEDVPGCAGTIGGLAVSTSAETTCTHTAVVADIGTFDHAVTADSDQTAAVLASAPGVTVNQFRPDARVRLGSGPVAGNGVYNATATGQARSTTVASRGTARFTVTLQNDGTAADSLTLRGPGSTSRYVVTYKVGATNITADVTSETGRLFSEVPVGALRTVTVLIRARPGAPRGAAITRKLTVSSAGQDLLDAVKLTVRRR